MIITAAQCRAARALLDWSQPDLAKKSGIHVQTISNFEHGNGSPTNKTLVTIRQTFENSGVELTELNGVRETSKNFRIFKGREGFREFYEDQYKIFRTIGGDCWLYNGVSKDVMEALGDEYVEMHKARMLKIKSKINYRIILEEGDSIMFGKKYAHYRWLPKKQFNNKTIFVYGPKVGLVNFDNDITVILIDQKEFSDTMRMLFENMWTMNTKEIIL